MYVMKSAPNTLVKMLTQQYCHEFNQSILTGHVPVVIIEREISQDFNNYTTIALNRA